MNDEGAIVLDEVDAVLVFGEVSAPSSELFPLVPVLVLFKVTFMKLFFLLFV
jgi:hypothetical protein